MIIRKARQEDSATIARLLFFPMEKIVYQFIGKEDPEKAFRFLLYFVQLTGNQYSYENTWLAEDENGILGLATLYDGADLEILRQPILSHLADHYCREIHVEDETQPGEIYLDCLAVFPEHQGKGIGTKLLEFLIERYVQDQKLILGLIVSETNHKARKLYSKVGFTCIRKRMFVGLSMEHMQVGS